VNTILWLFYVLQAIGFLADVLHMVSLLSYPVMLQAAFELKDFVGKVLYQLDQSGPMV
jgi:hypothetical protein